MPTIRRPTRKQPRRRTAVVARKRPTAVRPKRVYRKKTYVKPVMTMTRTIPKIYNSYQTLETLQVFQEVKADKINNINNQVYYSSAGPVNYNLNGLLQTSNTQYTNLRTAFRFYRLSSLTVRITPETWSSSTLQTGAVAPFLTDGEKPKIHWVNDDGSFAMNVATDPTGTVIASETIANAEKAGTRVKKEGYFVKPFTYKIKLYSRNKIPNETVANLGTQPDTYRSYGKWIPTSQLLDAPFANFFFGLTNTQADFKYKVEVFYTIGFMETI